MKKAIVYYSMSGNTDYVAKCISENIDVDLIKIEPKKKYPSKGITKFFWGGKSVLMGETPKLQEYEFDESKYDFIIFGSPVWASRIIPPIKSFIKANKNKLDNKKFAAFICYSGSGAKNAIEKLKKYLEIDKFDAELMLIDPKYKKSDDKDREIVEFCKQLNK